MFLVGQKVCISRFLLTISWSVTDILIFNFFLTASVLNLFFVLMQKKAKIAKVVNDLCKAVTEQVGTFIEAVAKIDDEEPDIDPYVQQPSMQTGVSRRAPKRKRRVSLSPIQEEEEFDEEESEEDDEMEVPQDVEDDGDTDEDESEEEDKEEGEDIDEESMGLPPTTPTPTLTAST